MTEFWDFICETMVDYGWNKYLMDSWSLSKIAANPQITFDILKNNPFGPPNYFGTVRVWNWYSICSNPNISLNSIVSLQGIKLRNNCISGDSRRGLSKNPSVTYGELKRRGFTDIDITLKSDVTFDMISGYNGVYLPNINCELFSSNLNVTWEIVMSNLYFPWDWNAISRHPNVTWDMIMSYYNGDLYKNGYHDLLSPYWIATNPNITMEIVKQYPNGPPGARWWIWYCKALSMNTNITIKMIKQNLSVTRYYKSIYGHHVTNETDSLNWKYLSANAGITWDDIIKNPELPWNCRWVSKNPNISITIVRKYPDGPPRKNQNKWRWSRDNLSSNPMNCPKYTSNIYRESLAKNVCKKISTELCKIVHAPWVHPGRYLSIDELEGHPLANFTPQKVREIYEAQKKCAVN